MKLQEKKSLNTYVKSAIFVVLAATGVSVAYGQSDDVERTQRGLSGYILAERNPEFSSNAEKKEFLELNLTLASPDSAYELAMLYAEPSFEAHNLGLSIFYLLLAESFGSNRAIQVLPNIRSQVAADIMVQLERERDRFIRESVVMPLMSQIYAPRAIEPIKRERAHDREIELPHYYARRNITHNRYVTFVIDEAGEVVDYWLPPGYSDRYAQAVEEFAETRPFTAGEGIEIVNWSIGLTQRNYARTALSINTILSSHWESGINGNRESQVLLGEFTGLFHNQTRNDLKLFELDEATIPQMYTQPAEIHELSASFPQTEVIFDRNGRIATMKASPSGEISAETESAIQEYFDTNHWLYRAITPEARYIIYNHENNTYLGRALPINEKFMEQYYWFERAARQNSLFSQHILAFSLLSPHWLEYFMLAGTDEEKERAALTLALKVSDAHYREQGIEYLEMLISEGNSDAVLKTAVDYAKTLI